MSINLVQPKKFIIRLAQCGTDTFSGGYKKMESEDGLELANRIVNIMAHDFIFKEKEPMFKYHLACLLLHQIEGYKTEELMEDIKNANNFLDKWKFRAEAKTTATPKTNSGLKKTTRSDKK